MTPFWEDDHLTLYGGDCRAVLASMPAESVHCVVTSPPYWGLRDYGTATWDGGDPACAHAFVADAGVTTIRKTQTYQQGHPHRNCKCGARRIDSQLGLEPTPEEYVANMVAVFREVKRVLRNDGTLWLNLGDSYASHDRGGYREGEFLNPGGRPPAKGQARNRAGTYLGRTGPIKPKDLVGIPWRVAFALQADGWYLRSDIIWAKPNPMPESVTDRPTKAHEYLFLLSKAPRYFFDADAVREANSPLTLEVQSHYKRPSPRNHKYAEAFGHKGGASLRVNGAPEAVNGHNVRSVWTVPEERTAPEEGGYSWLGDYGEQLAAKGGRMDPAIEKEIIEGQTSGGKELRDVWTIPTEPYKAAHFATFPRKLVEPCVKAGCPEGGTVLDPFAGSGTTLLVAQSLGRRGVGIDLNPDYLKQALTRNAQTPLGLVG